MVQNTKETQDSDIGPFLCATRVLARCTARYVAVYYLLVDLRIVVDRSSGPYLARITVGDGARFRHNAEGVEPRAC